MKTLSARFRPVLLSAVAGLYGLLPLPALAVDASLRADSYVSSSQPANNFGTVVGLQVGNGNRALLRFDLFTLPEGTLRRVQLQLLTEYPALDPSRRNEQFLQLQQYCPGGCQPT